MLLGSATNVEITNVNTISTGDNSMVTGNSHVGRNCWTITW